MEFYRGFDSITTNQQSKTVFYAGVLELAYIRVLESLAERIKGSTPFTRTNLGSNSNNFLFRYYGFINIDFWRMWA